MFCFETFAKIDLSISVSDITFSEQEPLEGDTDEDGIEDNQDVFPLNASESKDNDNDGIGDNIDTDDDNDGLSDKQEKILGTNPFNPDTDQDQVIDKQDVFPLDSTEWHDTDKDKIGDNVDLDDDNDGFTDEEELFVYGTNPLVPDINIKTAKKFQASIINTNIFDSRKILAIHLLALLLVVIFFFYCKKYD